MDNQRIQLEAIIYRKKGEIYEFLLLKRISEKGGFWQPPCGKMEKEDSTILEGSFREILEETSIKKEDILNINENVDYFEITKHYLTGEPLNPIVKEHVLGFEVGTEVVVSIENNIYPEHEEFKWVEFNDAIKLLKWQNNKDAFEKLKIILESTSK